MKKKFFWKDKSGRGFTNNSMNLDDLLKLENDTDWNGDELHEWAENADEGDKWEDAANEITCTHG